MKLYTRIGDSGSTRLFGNHEVLKSDPRVHAYGDVDELNSAIGLALAVCNHDEITDILTGVQHQLFNVGADLSTPVSENGDDSSPANANADTKVNPLRITQGDAATLENYIDQTCDPLPPMTQFILPGGCELASRLHLGRTICRRAERFCVELAQHEDGIGATIIYLNRLSDLLFALARRANQLENVRDVVWEKKTT